MKSSGVIKLAIRTLSIGFRPTEFFHIDVIGTGIKRVYLMSITTWLVTRTPYAYRELLRGRRGSLWSFFLVHTGLLLCILDHGEACSD